MKKILILDDDAVLRQALKAYLVKRHYYVQEAKSGQEGLGKFADFQPDLIISDVIMPDMNGFVFCRKIRSQPNGTLIPFIFLTVKGDIEDKTKAQMMGADDYLTKPIKLEELNLKIKFHLERFSRIKTEIIRLLQNNLKEVQATSQVIEREKLDGASDFPPDSLPLTPAEKRVFMEVIQGLTNKQISQNLHISPRTVQTHVRNILSKLGVENRTQLTYFAYGKGYKSNSVSD